MKLYAIKDTQTDEYLCAGQWGEEPEWFDARELQSVQVDRPSTVTEEHDFSPAEWM